MRKLKLLLAACAAMFSLGAIAQLTDGTVYWIQDASTGEFISQGAGWGTRATVQDVGGLGFEAVYVSEGVYKLKNIMWNKVNNADLGLRVTDGYCDQPASDVTLTASGDGYHVGMADGNYLCNNQEENSYGVKDLGLSENSSDATVWKFLTKTEYDAAIQAYKDKKAASFATSLGLTATSVSDLEAILAENYITKDYTSSITNAALNSGNTDGWTAIKPNERAQAFASENGTMAEAWNGCVVATQTVSGLPTGLYKVTFVGTFRPKGNTDSEKLTSEQTSSPAYVFANDAKEEFIHWIDVPAKANIRSQVKDNASAYTSSFYTYVTDGSLKLGVKQDTWYNGLMWCPFGYFTLTYYSDVVSDEDATAILSDATTLEGKKMNADVLSALTSAKSTFDGSRTIANYNALNTAMTNANASVTVYASLKAAIDKVEDAIKTTNVYDAALFASIKQGYEDQSISNADASDLANGGSWGDARYKSIFTKVLAANWKIGDKLATENESGLYQNAWSTEGNTDGTGMTTPFMEYWVADGDALAANTISNTITGLDADGTYAISLLVRVRQQNNQTKANDDITLSLNGGDAINMADGSVANNNAFFYKTITATANADAEGKIAIAINVKEGNHISWLAFKNVSYMNLSEVIAEFNQLKQNATTLMNNNAVVTGTEKTNLSNAIDASPSGMEGYSNAITALQDAIDAFSAAIPNYQAFDAEKTIAQELGVSDIPSPTTGAEAQAAVNQLKVNEYNYVTETYTSDVTSVLPAWTLTNIAGDTKGQHWSGDGNKTYFDRWNGAAITSTVSATYNLPAGQYAFYAAGRGQAEKSTAKLTMTIGEETKEISYVMKGDTGFGIDKTGKANFTAGEDTYANDNKGRGWEWRFITFLLTEATDVTFSAVSTENGSWASFADLTLATTSDNTGIIQQMIAKEVKNAEDLRDNAANVGDGVFQIPNSAVVALNGAISVANSTSSISEVESAISALQQAEADFRNAELNAPADGQLFNVILTFGGWTYDQKAMTYLAGDRADMGGYNIKYNAPANENLAQAFTFTKVEGNNYKMSQIDADGNVRYMTTGVPYGGNTSQIRTSTNAEDAMLVTVIPTATEGVWNLKNTEANNFIGSQDAGVYTVNSHIDFNIVETTKPSIAINTTAAGYGTTMLPFAVAELPSGVKAYTCAGIDGTTLTLEEVTTLAANKPYIIEGAWNETVTGDAQGTTLTYTEGLLTGVYAETAAPVESYVLQSQNDVTGFYKVAEGKQPNVPANHAYLTAPSEARVLYFDNATAIRAIEVLTSGEAEIYNAAGARQNGLQKGVNIIKQGNKTFKVMVK